MASRQDIARCAPGDIVGAGNTHACAVDGVVIITVPYEGLDDILTGMVQSIGDHIAVSAVGSVDSDVILTGDDDHAKALVAHLLTALRGVRIIDGGLLCNYRLVEELTVLLLAINGRYRRHTGVRITDLPDDVVANRSAPAL